MIAAIILAAGESRRMGANKMLFPLGETTVIGHVVDQFQKSRAGRIIVVAGHEAERTARALADRKIVVAENPVFTEGMLSSVRRGLEAIPVECQGIMVGLGDQPSVSAEVIDRLIGAFEEQGKGIVVPAYNGKRGHPLLFSERYRAEILTQYDEVGLSGLLQAHADDVFELTVDTPSILNDMDYPEDYRREIEAVSANRARRG